MKLGLFEQIDSSGDPDIRRTQLLDVLLMWFFAGLAAYAAVGLVGWVSGLIDAGAILFFIGLSAIGLIGAIYAVNRSGRLQIASWMFVLALSGVVIILLLMYGHRGGVTMLIPVTILAAAMLLRQRGIAFIFAVALGAFYLLVAWLEVSGRWNAWLHPFAEPFPADLLISGRVMGIWLMAVLAWLSAGSLTTAIEIAQFNLRQAQQHERELEQARVDLEAQVSARTQDLERALAQVQQDAVRQQALLDTVRRQAFPVIPILDQLVAVPVIGVLDAARADQLLTSLLEGIQRYESRFALLDITGAPVMDQEAAQALAQAVSGARMIGAECILVGVNPDVAARLVDLGGDIDVSDFVSRVDMQAGVRYALGQMYGRANKSREVYDGI